MDWSGALALRTSRERQHTANYGSFRQYGLPRASHEVLVPQSIPEDEPVEQFRSPLLRRELHEPARVEAEIKAKSNNSYASLGFISPSAARFRSGVSPRPQFGGATASNSSSMSSAEARKHEQSQAFKRWLATDKQKRIEEIMKGTAGSPFGKDSKPATRAPDDNSTHWMQERERIRLQRMLRRAAEQEAEEDAPMPNWKMTAIMCSVPFVLLVVFFVLVMILGKDTRKAALAKMHIIHAAEFEHFGDGLHGFAPPSYGNKAQAHEYADPTTTTPSSPATVQHLRATYSTLHTLAPLANDIARAAARMPVSVDD